MLALEMLRQDDHVLRPFIETQSVILPRGWGRGPEHTGSTFGYLETVKPQAQADLSLKSNLPLSLLNSQQRQQEDI